MTSHYLASLAAHNRLFNVQKVLVLLDKHLSDMQQRTLSEWPPITARPTHTYIQDHISWNMCTSTGKREVNSATTTQLKDL